MLCLLKSYGHVLAQVSGNVALFGNAVFEEVIKLRSREEINNCILIEKGNVTHTGKNAA